MRAAPVAHDTLEAARGPENPRVSFGVLRLVCALLGTISFGSIRFHSVSDAPDIMLYRDYRNVQRALCTANNTEVQCSCCLVLGIFHDTVKTH